MLFIKVYQNNGFTNYFSVVELPMFGEVEIRRSIQYLQISYLRAVAARALHRGGRVSNLVTAVKDDRIVKLLKILLIELLRYERSKIIIFVGLFDQRVMISRRQNDNN